MEFRAFRAKKTSFGDDVPFVTAVTAKENLPSPKTVRAADFLGNALALLRVYGGVNYTYYCKFAPK